MNKAETRAEHIDPALKAAGWGVVEGSRVLREHGITLGRLQGNGGKGGQSLRAKGEIADYVLVYRNTKLAVIEAKAWDKPHTEGVGQAKSYAAKLAVRFTYATNGQAIYGIDMVTGLEADVACYPSPDDLWKLTFVEVNAWRERFAAAPFEDKGGTWQGRYYQDIAITRVLEAIEAGPKPTNMRILLTLASGTGKTFIAFQLAWKLFQSRWNLADWTSGAGPRELGTRRPRILFLADRNILADQAYNAFSAFPDDALVRIAPDDTLAGVVGNRLHERRVATQPGDRRHIHDAPALARQHALAANQLCQQEDTADVEVHHLVPGLDRVLLSGRAPGRTGVIDQDVHMAQACNGVVCQARHVGVLAGIGGNPLSLDAFALELRNGSLELGCLARREQHRRTGLARACALCKPSPREPPVISAVLGPAFSAVLMNMSITNQPCSPPMSASLPYRALYISIHSLSNLLLPGLSRYGVGISFMLYRPSMALPPSFGSAGM